MKKIVALALVLILIFTFCACGGNSGPGTGAGDDLTNQTVAGAPNEDNLDTSSDDSTSGQTDTPLISNGDYHCYDRFSGEAVPGSYIRIHSSNTSQVVFDYVTSAGTFTSVTAYLDSGYNSNVNLTGTLSLTMTFSSSSITVDEIEGMGAMAYVFK